jgi:MFS transporter, DHA1 family, multidrug resistance protein
MCTDMYLPSFPTIARDLGTSDSVVQLTLTTCLLGLAFGQLLAGPLSDRLGRRPPLLAGLVVFTAASLVCAVAPNAGLLLAARLVQGLAGAAGIVIARAVVRDLFSGDEAARFFATLMLVMGVAPILAPLAGAEVLKWTSWRGVFVVLACFGALLVPSVLVGLPETLKAQSRRSGGVMETARMFADLLRHRALVGLSLTSGLVSGAMFAYIAGATFVLQQVYGLSPQQFGLVFGSNALGIIVASQVGARLLGRLTPRFLLWAGVVQATTGAALLLAAAAGGLPLAAVLVALFVVISSIGLVQPNATALALEDHASAAGSAAALLGVSQLAIGALLAPIVGIFGGSTLSLAVVMAASAFAALLTLSLAVPRGRRPRSASTSRPVGHPFRHPKKGLPMADAVIVATARTPGGRRGGSLSGRHPAELAAQVLRAVVERSGIDATLVDDVLMGCVTQVGPQSTNVARTALLAAGFPETVPGTTIDRQCGSSQQALHFAAQGVASGAYDVVIAAGVECMSTVPMFSNVGGDVTTVYGDAVDERYAERKSYGHTGLVPQGISAELVADKWGLSRPDLDAYGLPGLRGLGVAFSPRGAPDMDDTLA